MTQITLSHREKANREDQERMHTLPREESRPNPLATVQKHQVKGKVHQQWSSAVASLLGLSFLLKKREKVC